MGAAIGGLAGRLRGLAGAVLGSSVEVGPYDPDRHGPLVRVEGDRPGEEVERYWVDPPFALVSIVAESSGRADRYRVAEPALDGWERTLLATLTGDLRDRLVNGPDLSPENAGTVVESALRDQLEAYGVRPDVGLFYSLLYYLLRRFRGLGPVEPLLRDPAVEDVSCDGMDTPLYVYHADHADLRTDVCFDGSELDDFVVRLAQRSGRSISVGEPLTNAMLPDGSRAELALGTAVTPNGSAFTIRKYAERPMTPIALVENGTFSLAHMAYFWLAIESNKSLLFAGGTASGKTTSMNAVSMFIPPRSKVVSIEDTQEIRLAHEHWLPAVTRESVPADARIDMYRLLRSALRHRPEYILVGEVRGVEATTLFQAMNTGHTTYSTMHADSTRTALNRLENEPLSIPRAMIGSLDVLTVQHIAHLAGERHRRARSVAEIQGVDPGTGEIRTRRVFSWLPETDDFRWMLDRSDLLDGLRDESGWSRGRLRRELRNRVRVLAFARARSLTDYRPFTRLVADYYADPNGVLDRVADELDGADRVEPMP